MREPSTEGLLIWMILYIILIIGLFWTLYKTIKTKNAKYGYAVLLNVILMVLLLFI
jgi:hypothetical protein